MQFEFATAARIVFGAGSLLRALDSLPELGARALLISGRDATRAAPLIGRLHQLGIEYTQLGVNGEPSVSTVIEGVALGREFGAQFLIGFGGGSALDTAKAIAGLIPNPGAPLDYLEVVGEGKPLEQQALPSVAIPTTAGTGSEVTKNAVVASPEHQVKVSLRHPSMLPRLAIVDSQLTHSLSASLTAATGLDALTQCLEPYLSCHATPMTDGLAREGILRAARSLKRAYHDGHDAQARDDMALASLFGGLALANAKLGAVHGFAGPIGGMVDAPHGAVCARLLPLVFAANHAALSARAPEDPVLQRMHDVAHWLTGDPSASVANASAWLARLVTELDIPGLRRYGMTQAQLPELVTKAQRASSMRGNPIELTQAELLTIAERALDDPSGA